MPTTTLQQWVKKIRGSTQTVTSSPPNILDTGEEMRKLRKENNRLREEVEILNLATAFFAKESQ